MILSNNWSQLVGSLFGFGQRVIWAQNVAVVLVNFRYYFREEWWNKGREICWEASGLGDLLLAMRWRASVISFWEREVILGFLLGWTFK